MERGPERWRPRRLAQRRLAAALPGKVVVCRVRRRDASGPAGETPALLGTSAPGSWRSDRLRAMPDLHDPSPQARRIAAIALGKRGGEGSVAALRTALETEEVGWVRP